MLSHFPDELEVWEASGAANGQVGALVLDVAPDALHKANISGGAPYGVFVPDASVDATFRFDDGVLLPFIEYLKLAFRYGGFAGFWKRDCGGEGAQAKRKLAEGLLEL